MRALIIEDECLIAWLVEDMLAELGVTLVEFASSEADAVALAERNCPDLVIADSHLAQGSGAAAARAICADKPVPTIFVTADAASVTGIIPGAAILDKPLTRKELAEAFNAAFSDVLGPDLSA